MIQVRRMLNEFEVNNLLQGGIRFPLQLKGNVRIFGLHGLTMVFTAPAGTVTFADANTAGLLVRDIMDQIVADVAALRPQYRDGVLYLRQVTPTAAVVLDGSTSTAQSALALPNTLSGTFYTVPGGVAPSLISVTDSAQSDGLVLTTEEA